VTAEQAIERHRAYGVDAVLIGRGALRNPFLFKQARALFEGRPAFIPTFDDYLALLEAQRVLLSEAYNAQGAMIHARKFLSWYATGYPGCHEFRKRVFASKDLETLWLDTRAFFEGVFEKMQREGRDLSFMAQPFLMGGHG
jgi:tRNA-dihydrouridine synthase B